MIERERKENGESEKEGVRKKEIYIERKTAKDKDRRREKRSRVNNREIGRFCHGFLSGQNESKKMR